MHRDLRTILLELTFAALAMVGSPSCAQGASAPGGEPVLRVVVADGRARAFTSVELERLPAETATATLRDRPPFAVTGVSVTVLLRETGLDLSTNLGSAAVVSRALVARAGDGYRAVFGLADVDPHFGHSPLLVIWKSDDGSALPERSGPFELINTGESRPGRWVRQLQSLEVRELP